MVLTRQKACALLEGLEAGLDRSALVRLPFLLRSSPPSMVILIYSVKPRPRLQPLQLVKGQYRNSSVVPKMRSRGLRNQWRLLRYSIAPPHSSLDLISWIMLYYPILYLYTSCNAALPLKSMKRSTWIAARGIAVSIDHVIRFQRFVNLTLLVSSLSTFLILNGGGGHTLIPECQPPRTGIMFPSE